MTRTPEWIINECIARGFLTKEEVLAAMICAGYGLKKAKKRLREFEDLGLIYWNEAGEIKKNFLQFKSTIAVPSLTENSEK